jgi:hypothetical protein
MVRRGPERGGVGRNPQTRTSIIVAVIAIAAALVYLAFQLPWPAQGPDAGYYLLGCEHLDAGAWPWGSEPPLAFIVLYPWVKILPPVVGLTACSAVLGGITIWLMAYLCGKLGGKTAAVIGAILSFGFMVPSFVTGLLKNEVVNVLLIAVLIAIVAGRYWLASGGILLAATAHPGVTLTFGAALAAAIVLARLQRAIVQGRRGPAQLVSPQPFTPSRARSGGAWLVLGVALLAGAWVAAPTVARYLSSYLSRDAGEISSQVFQWDVGALSFFYLPLWPFVALTISRLDLGAVTGAWRRPGETAKATLFTWIVVLLGLASVTGMASRRFEVQLFIPMVALAAPEMADWLRRVVGASPVRNAARRSSVVITIVFGLAMVTSMILGRSALLDAAQVADLQALAHVLPEDARIVVVLSDARYWVEYYVERPVLGPFLARERLTQEGPLFLLTQDPTNERLRWPAETLEELAKRDAVVWNANGILVLRAEWDEAFLDNWQDPRDVEALASLAGVEVPPGWGPRGPVVSPAGAAAGWLLFWPLGLVFSLVPVPAIATAIGLPAAVAFWWAVVCLFRARRQGTGAGVQRID